MRAGMTDGQTDMKKLIVASHFFFLRKRLKFILIVTTNHQ